MTGKIEQRTCCDSMTDAGHEFTCPKMLADAGIKIDPQITEINSVKVDHQRIQQEREQVAARAQALGLGKVAYERFAELRIAAIPKRALYMPPWDDAPSFGGVGGASGLPDSEKEIWAQVALAVRAYIPFVITDAVLDALAQAPTPAGWSHVTDSVRLRAAAEAAGFRVEER